MELSQLETFLAVVTEGSFSRAASKLHRTQPGVSQIIRRLEDAVGEPLFDRSSRNGSLTAAGQLLREYAEKLLNLRDETHSAIQDLRTLHTGKLAIAANEFTCLYLLRVLDRFRRVHPMIKIAVQRSLASRIPQLVLNHEVELGVLTFRPEDNLRSIVVYRDELVFVVHPQHPLASSGEISIRQLGAETFVAHNVPSPYRAKVLDAFQRHRTPLHMDIELPTLEAIRNFVALGLGVALVPGLSVESEIQRGILVSVTIKELKLERKLRLVHRKHAPLSHAARALLEIVQAKASDKQSRFLFIKE